MQQVVEDGEARIRDDSVPATDDQVQDALAVPGPEPQEPTSNAVNEPVPSGRRRLVCLLESMVSPYPLAASLLRQLAQAVKSLYVV